MHKSIRKPAIGAEGPSRDPTAVKSNNMQELAVEIPPSNEGSFVQRVKNHHVMPVLGHKMTHSSSAYVNHIRGCVLAVEKIFISHKWECVSLSPGLPRYHKRRKEKKKKENHGCGWSSRVWCLQTNCALIISARSLSSTTKCTHLLERSCKLKKNGLMLLRN